MVEYRSRGTGPRRQTYPIYITTPKSTSPQYEFRVVGTTVDGEDFTGIVRAVTPVEALRVAESQFPDIKFEDVSYEPSNREVTIYQSKRGLTQTPYEGPRQYVPQREAQTFSTESVEPPTGSVQITRRGTILRPQEVIPWNLTVVTKDNRKFNIKVHALNAKEAAQIAVGKFPEATIQNLHRAKVATVLRGGRRVYGAGRRIYKTAERIERFLEGAGGSDDESGESLL